MNRIPSPRRTRAKRIAAATAVVVGAALLVLPGAAAGQDTAPVTEADCGGLGDAPVAAGLEAAVETAVTCDVEVRVASRSTPYSTVSVTPDGRLRLVSTAEPVQAETDATLVEVDGALVQADTPWPIRMNYGDAEAPLLQTDQSDLYWDGESPVPAYSGTTAAYDELAAGLDLAVDADVSSADLRFTIADESAWNALASGLALPTPAAVDRGAIKVRRSGGMYLDEYSTAFTVREADGRIRFPALTRASDGSLAISLDAAVIAGAEFPLTLTTTWGFGGSQGVSWGSVASGAPSLAIFRGEGRPGEPYFPAIGETGDAIVGTYCAKSADPECAGVPQAASYWQFGSADLASLLPGGESWVTFPVTEASFQVDAAAGTTCIAPKLTRGSYGYTPTTTWNYRSTPVATAATGECRDGKAVYDVTSALQGTGWSTSGYTFGMTASAETARFDGGSARLEVRLDLRNYSLTPPACDNTAADPRFQKTSRLTYGDFTAQTWRTDLLNEITWTAAVRDADTGETIIATDPAVVADGAGPAAAVDLPDGRYEIAHEFTSSTGTPLRSTLCHVVIDTATPDFLDIEVQPGPKFLGDTVTVEVSVSDEGFPDGVNALTIECSRYPEPGCQNEVEVLTEDTAATFRVRLDAVHTSIGFQVVDKAFNRSATEYVDIDATQSHSDFNNDGRLDMMVVRKSDGALMFFAGKGDGTFAAGVSKGAGWGAMDLVLAGDLTGDRQPDLLARDTRTGTLYTYPGIGAGGLGTRIQVGTGWNAMGAFTSNGDFDGDGKNDMYAVGESDGKLYFYRGKGDGTFAARTAVGTGWGVMDTVTAFAAFDDDEDADLLARDQRDGEYYVYYGRGDGTVGSRERISDFFEAGSLNTAQYNEIFAGGDYDENGTKEVVSIDALTGSLVMHSFDELGSPVYPTRVVATGWSGYRLPGVLVDRTYDYNASATTDLVARNASSGTVYVYTGNGTGGFGPRIAAASLANMNLLEAAGDLDGDGIADLLARVASTGSLYIMPGTAYGDFDYYSRMRIGTGWNSMSAIVSGHDFNGDGKIDVIAREKSTGYLWLYPGKGDGYLGSRVKIGTGWSAMREITAAGDLDHDGHADVLAIRGSDNCMYFYSGRGNGTLRSGVKMSCNWVGYDMVAAVGDFNGDGHGDWTARRKSDGALFLYKGNAAGGYASRVQIGTGWNSMNIIA
ncbi:MULTISPECIES: FG-GAP-like repeat-containing protein [Glycomyces]|uniref:FG-GAP-like repeat-containing protein n=2 Tax=Glycomyces TaxID=58113 RepID=A0A9X3PMR1_9ACTN|nr:FG-GAP-like repeat-containing protein [Glycomyces lechevalierae]MDA1388329.1 FG-GAP-like repeat-containing protein [Glycomyces lechevalierae]MDR7338714.1 hypothetical protein [Glycomyces lechevalierae]